VTLLEEPRRAHTVGRRHRDAALAIIAGMAAPEQPPATRLHLERLLLAPPERVFSAFTDPERLRRWWGPAGFAVQSLEFDAAEGTDYRITMQPPNGDVFHIRGTFRAVEAPRRLVFTFSYEEPDPDDQETLVTLTLDPEEAGTRLVLDQEPFRTAARWELHRQGWTETLERLEQSLRSTPSQLP
jgi:uncharacterized protein YndB with AHSA1/START domain